MHTLMSIQAIEKAHFVVKGTNAQTTKSPDNQVLKPPMVQQQNGLPIKRRLSDKGLF